MRSSTYEEGRLENVKNLGPFKKREVNPKNSVILPTESAITSTYKQNFTAWVTLTVNKTVHFIVKLTFAAELALLGRLQRETLIRGATSDLGCHKGRANLACL